jgi:hypothetical protein
MKDEDPSYASLYRRAPGCCRFVYVRPLRWAECYDGFKAWAYYRV